MMHERYSDRMIRPTASAPAPSVTFVREGNRLIPIPTAPAAPSSAAADDEGSA
jgi:hypothetical protein